MEAILFDKKTQINKIIDDLDSFCKKNEINSNSVIETKDKLTKKELFLVVVGEFNRGKSTFINSLISENVLPTGVTPTTSTINLLKYNTEKSITFLYNDNSRDKKELSENSFNELEYENIKQVEINHNAPFLKNTIIIDTPGVNDLNTQKSEITYNFIPQADVIIFLLDAEQVLSKSEFDFLQNKLLNNDLNKIIFVINKTDNLQKEELDDVLFYAKQKLSNHFNNPQIVPYSAKKALEAKNTNDNEKLEKSNYINLIKVITNDVFDKQDSILLESTNKKLHLLLSNINSQLNTKKVLYNKPILELEDDLALLNSKKEEINLKLESIINNFLISKNELKNNEISKLKTFSLELYNVFSEDLKDLSYQDIKTYMNSFIETSFKEHIEVQEIEIKANMLEIYNSTLEKIEKIFKDIKEEINLKIELDQIKLKSINKTSHLDLGSSTLMQSGLFIMFFGSLFALIGGLLMVAGGGFLSTQSKKDNEKNFKNELKNIAQQGISSSTEKIVKKLSEIIDEMGNKIVENFNDIFNEEFELLNSSIRKVLEHKKSEEYDLNIKIEEINNNINYLNEIKNKLNNLEI